MGSGGGGTSVSAPRFIVIIVIIVVITKHGVVVAEAVDVDDGGLEDRLVAVVAAWVSQQVLRDGHTRLLH